MQTGSTLMSLFSFASRRRATTLKKLLTANELRWKWYTTIDFLPVRNFYMVVETSDKRWLLKGIDYENLPECKIDLDLAWEKIWAEFITISKDRDYQIYFETIRKLAVMESKYEYLKAEIYTLYYRFNQTYADDLAREGITLCLDSREKYIDSLNVAAQRITSYDTKIALLKKELEARSNIKGKDRFEDLVDAVERYRGQPIDIDTLSIKRFILMLNKIKEENGKRKN